MAMCVCVRVVCVCVRGVLTHTHTQCFRMCAYAGVACVYVFIRALKDNDGALDDEGTEVSDGVYGYGLLQSCFGGFRFDAMCVVVCVCVYAS